MKWNMGWMHDMLDYFAQDPLYRKFYQNNITFSMLYAFSENFVLPISHDEVVHGKKSLLSKMPGDMWQKFANVRAFLAYMYGHPGKKLLYMGAEIGQWEEWSEERSLPWEVLTFPFHRKLQDYVRELNLLYSSHPAFYEVDYSFAGFEWVDFRDGRSLHHRVHPASRGRWPIPAVLLQLHAGPASQLPVRCPRSRLLPRDPQFRLRLVRRK